MDELIERLADQEHERWSGWMRHMFDHWTVENVARWKQQMVTSYADLPEHSKESDRKEAHKTMEIVGPIIAQLEAKIESYRKAYEQAVETAWQGESVRLPDLDDMLAWIEQKESEDSK